MKGEDIENLESLLRRVPEFKPRSVLVLSPTREKQEESMVRRVFGDSTEVDSFEEVGWNLDLPIPTEKRWDMVVACNTFMCANDPSLWLSNISKVANFLAIQDLCVAKRMPDRHCAVHDRDVARYSVSSHGLLGETDPTLTVFDISKSGYRIVDAGGYGNLKFVAVLDLRALSS